MTMLNTTKMLLMKEERKYRQKAFHKRAEADRLDAKADEIKTDIDKLE